MKYRAVFCDIDGTLLDSAHTLRPATAKGIRSLHERGTPFILVSARSPGGILPIQAKIGIQAPIVCFGGALVLGKEREPVHSLGMDMNRTLGLKERIHAAWPGVTSSVYSHNQWFVDDASDRRVKIEADITAIVPTEVPALELPAHAATAHKILCDGNPADILAMEQCLTRENPDLAVVKSSDRFLEIMNGQATKANAMQYLCQAMRIPLAEVVAFGDNYNDADMLAHAGLGIAMANAPEEVRKIADRVTVSNDDEGVLKALETLEFVQMDHSIRFDRASFRG